MAAQDTSVRQQLDTPQCTCEVEEREENMMLDAEIVALQACKESVYAGSDHAGCAWYAYLITNICRGYRYVDHNELIFRK